MVKTVIVSSESLRENRQVRTQSYPLNLTSSESAEENDGLQGSKKLKQKMSCKLFYLEGEKREDTVKIWE